jgi:hypothetical protein
MIDLASLRVEAARLARRAPRHVRADAEAEIVAAGLAGAPLSGVIRAMLRPGRGAYGSMLAPPQSAPDEEAPPPDPERAEAEAEQDARLAAALASAPLSGFERAVVERMLGGSTVAAAAAAWGRTQSAGTYAWQRACDLAAGRRLRGGPRRAERRSGSGAPPRAPRAAAPPSPGFVDWSNVDYLFAKRSA